jgi:hypothetical protein
MKAGHEAAKKASSSIPERKRRMLCSTSVGNDAKGSWTRGSRVIRTRLSGRSWNISMARCSSSDAVIEGDGNGFVTENYTERAISLPGDTSALR